MIWIGALLALFSLLAVFRAPVKPLWFVAIGVTEWGHWMAIGSLLIALVSWRASRRWGAASWLALAASLLYLSPLVRAEVLAQSLPQQFYLRFGSPVIREKAEAPARRQPLSRSDLFLGVKTAPVRVDSMVYATIKGQPLSLDLYRPLDSAGQKLPGLVVVHGGSWQSGSRKEFETIDRYLAARGYLVASIDYRLAPDAIFPAQRDDVFSAITYLKKHAAEIGLDADEIVLLGRSAGGQVALSAAYAEKEPAIKGVIIFYTPNDLVWGYSKPGNPLIMNSRNVIATYLGGTPKEAPGAYEAASPLLFVNKNTPPTLMIHGVRDELVSALHEERLSKRLTEERRPFFYLRLPWATHGCDVNFSGPSGQLSTYVIERFLAAVTSGGK